MNVVESLDPPHLDLAFYVGRSKAVEEAVRAIQALANSGASFTGDVDVVHENTESRLVIRDVALLRDNGVQHPERIYIRSATGITDKTEFIKISGDVILLRTEAEEFCGPSRTRQGRLFELGTKAYRAFKTIASGIDAAYGGICIEWPLEDLATLKRDPRSLAFQNFFISRAALGERAIEEIVARVGQGAHVEQVERGIYVSMTAEFNPEHRAVTPIEAQYRSVRVAELLVKHLRFPPW
jgi:hypothetical protein